MRFFCFLRIKIIFRVIKFISFKIIRSRQVFRCIIFIFKGIILVLIMRIHLIGRQSKLCHLPNLTFLRRFLGIKILFRFIKFISIEISNFLLRILVNYRILFKSRLQHLPIMTRPVHFDSYRILKKIIRLLDFPNR